MPFDATGFPAGPDRPERPGPSDGAVTAIIVALAFCLLVLPISLGAFVDIVRYLRGH